jgi:hypothetical protein
MNNHRILFSKRRCLFKVSYVPLYQPSNSLQLTEDAIFNPIFAFQLLILLSSKLNKLAETKSFPLKPQME